MPSGPAHRPVTTARTTRARSGRDERQKRPRPPPHWFTLGSLRSFGERIVHPPPPAVEEDYFMFVSPRFKISLEDVVTDKHLPPLSLQDFEDYLQHVDGTPENLYFHLWARHYRRIHRAWAESVLPTIPSSSKGIYRSRDLWERLAHCQDRQLKEEFAFAKATFFDEHAPMRLQISDELRRQVMHVHNMPPQAQELTNKLPSFPQQPEPGHFDAVLAHVDAQLQTAFDKFVFLAFRNSGLWHSCLGHLLGVVILASGMALWCAGIARGKGRPFVAASLPLIWFGVWFMLVSANGHCLAVYSTGDARQLYPHEFARPSQPDDVPPPIYSIARSVDAPCPPSYATSRKTSGASATLLPVTNLPHKTYVGKGRRKSDGAAWWKGRWTRERSEVRRMSEGLVKIFGRRERNRPCVDEEAASMDDGSRRTTAEIEHRLPPARQTKGLLRDSFALDILPPMEGPAPLPPAITATRRGGIAGLEIGLSELEAGRYQVSFQTDDRADSPGEFTEENDFGIIVSEAFDEEDQPYAYNPQPADDTSAVNDSTSGPATTTLEPVSPLGPGPEYLAQRRMTMPDIFAPPARAGSENAALEWVMKEVRQGGGGGGESGGGRIWPWPRRLFGPMTLVHSPIVRRAHWGVTVRTAIVASVVTVGMAVGLVG